MSSLDLGIRTAVSTVYEGPVYRIRAEDLEGWFGIRPGRWDLAAVLPPGLLLFEDSMGEAFVSLAGGLLDFRGGHCRVLAREAVLARDLDEISDLTRRQALARRRGPSAQRDVFDDLAKEALRRLRWSEAGR